MSDSERNIPTPEDAGRENESNAIPTEGNVTESVPTPAEEPMAADAATPNGDASSETVPTPTEEVPQEGDIPTEGVPQTADAPAEGTPHEADMPTGEASSEEKSAEETPAPQPAPATTYRWTYAEQAAHENRQGGTKRRNGVLVYAIAMTGVFLISIGLLIAVLLLGDNSGLSSGNIIQRPGISDSADDDEAVEGVEQAKRSVVVIEVTTASGGGTGTGIIMTADGYIATNHHVIDGATKVRVTFYDGTVEYAEIVGSSEMDDLGVIKVNRTGLPAATFADSGECYVGQTVYAIGTPAGAEFAWTTTKGIISYVDREIKMYDEDDGTLLKKLRLLQTDANVNPGNSGGPLINTKGEVVGVVSMKLSEGYEGIGFAIPSDGAVEILEAIMLYGNADSVNSSLSHKRPMLGITGVYMEANVHYLLLEDRIQEIPEEDLGLYNTADLICPAVSGIYVMGITEGMDATDKLMVGDIITAVQGLEITSMNDLMNEVNEYYAGDTITLTIYRGSIYTPVDITLSAQPGQ